MRHTDITPRQSVRRTTDTVFDDPVAYLARFGLDAEIVFDSVDFPEAA